MQKEELTLAGGTLALAFALAVVKAMVVTARELATPSKKKASHGERRDSHPADEPTATEEVDPASRGQGGGVTPGGGGIDENISTAEAKQDPDEVAS